MALPVSNEVTEPKDAEIADREEVVDHNGTVESTKTTAEHKHQEDGNGDDEEEAGDRGGVVTDPSLLPEAKKRKKKKSGKSKGQRGLASSPS